MFSLTLVLSAIALHTYCLAYYTDMCVCVRFQSALHIKTDT